MACSRPGVAADQDVPLQADHHQPGARPGEPSEAGGDPGGSDEDVTRGDPPQMGQSSIGKGEGLLSKNLKGPLQIGCPSL